MYLPAGARWTDYCTGKTYDGGQWIEADGTLPRLPLFVKAGSIIATTEVAEYADAQIGKPVTFTIYPGRDADFTLYEDEGDNYNYEQGACTTIAIHWDDARNTLTIDDRQGSYPGMLSSRTFYVKTPKGTKRVNYQGQATFVTI